MTMDIRNLTAEQKAMILKAGEDGFNADELRELGLNRKNAEELYKSLAGETEEVGDKAAFSSDIDTLRAEREKLDQEAKLRKQQYKEDASVAWKEGKPLDWLANSWKYSKAPDGAYSQAKSPLAALLPFAIALVATSCDFLEIPEPIIPEKNNEIKIDVVQNTNATVNVTIIKNGISVEEFAALLAPFMQQILDAIKNNNCSEVLNDILATLLEQNDKLKSLAEIKKLLESMNSDSEAIKNLLEQTNEKLDGIKLQCKELLDRGKTTIDVITELRDNQGVAFADIIIALQNNGKKLDEIIKALANNGQSLSEIYKLMVENNIDNKEVLKAMNKLIGETSDVGKKLDTIIKLQETGVKLDTETQNIVFKVLDAVNNLKLEGGTFDTANIEKALAAILDAISNLPTKDDVKQMNGETSKLLKGIYALIEKFMTQDQAMDEKTLALIDNLTIIVNNFATAEAQNDKEVKAMLGELTKLVANFKEQEKLADEKSMEVVNKVLEAVKNLKLVGGNGDVNVDLSVVEKTLAQMLAAINKLATRDDLAGMKDEILDAINKQTEVINKFMEKTAEMDEKELALGQKILDKIGSLDLSAGDVNVEVDLSKLEAMMSILVEKAGNLDATTEAILEAVLNGNKDFGKALDEIKDLIIKNNNIAQGTQDLVAKLGDKFDGLGDDIKAILLKILDEEQKQNVKSADMLKVLNAIKGATDENGKTLLRIEDKLNLAAQSIDVLINEVADMHEGTKALLIKILDKIPAACDCNIDEVLIKLEEIITVIKENPSDNNEGIVDDLEDLLK